MEQAYIEMSYSANCVKPILKANSLDNQSHIKKSS